MNQRAKFVLLLLAAFAVDMREPLAKQQRSGFALLADGAQNIPSQVVKLIQS